MFEVNNKIKKNAAFFAIGGIGYGIIELIWRGYTHPAMITAGGVCFVLFSIIAERYKEKPLIYKAALSALVVTAVELVFGVVFNIIFKMHIWDYSKMPLNLFGQICPFFTLAWGAIAFIFIPIAEVLSRSMAKGWIFNRRKTFRV